MYISKVYWWVKETYFEPIGPMRMCLYIPHFLDDYFIMGSIISSFICVFQNLLATNDSDYEAQLLLGQSLASFKMLKYAESAFRAATRIDELDYRGWKVLILRFQISSFISIMCKLRFVCLVFRQYAYQI